MKKLKKFIGIMLLSILLVNVFAFPVSAQTQVASAPSDLKTYTFAGNLYKNTTLKLCDISVSTNDTSKLYIYTPNNNGYDYYEGKIYFTNTITGDQKIFYLANYAPDQWTIHLSSYLNPGPYRVTFTGSATGASRQASVYYKYQP